MRNWISPLIEWRLFRMRSARTHTHTQRLPQIFDWLEYFTWWVLWKLFAIRFSLLPKPTSSSTTSTTTTTNAKRRRCACIYHRMAANQNVSEISGFSLRCVFDEFSVHLCHFPLFRAFFAISLADARHSFSALVYSIPRPRTCITVECGYISLNATRAAPRPYTHFISTTHI